MDSVPDPCKEFLKDGSNEIQHAKELLIMEEEARIRRRNLSKRINYEHCIQQKERYDLIKKIEHETSETERKQTHEIHKEELVISGIQARTEVLQECLANRKKDLTRCHDKEVERLNEYMGRLTEKLEEIKALEPETIKELEDLRNPQETESSKVVKELEEQLRAVRSNSRDLCRQMKDEKQEMQKEQENLLKDEDIIQLEDELKDAEQEAKRVREQQEDDIDDVEYEIDQLEKEADRLGEKSVEEVEDRLHGDITALEEELEEEQNTYDGLDNEGAELEDHFVRKFESKLRFQERKIEEDRAELGNKNEQVEKRMQELEEMKNELPGEYDNKGRLKREQLQGKFNQLKEIQNDTKERFANEMKKLQSEQSEQLDRLQDKLAQLEEKKSQVKETFDASKAQMEKQIQELTKEIPRLSDEIDKTDKNFVDSISDKQGDLGKTDIINQMLKQTNDNALNHFNTEIENLDALIENTKAENEAEIARKEEELQEVLNRHRKVGTDLEFIDKRVRAATRELKGETDHLKYKIQCLSAIIRDLNKTLANLDGSAAETEHELQEIMKRAGRSHEEEKERLEKLIEGEEKDQDFACDQLRDAINRATERHEEMLTNHKEQRNLLIDKLVEKKKLLDTKYNLDKEVDDLGTKIQDIDNKLENAIARHDVNVKQAENQHANQMKSLNRKKAAQLFRIDQQEKLDGKVSEMQKMLDSVNHGLEAINEETIAAEKEEEEELQSELGDIKKQNDKISKKIQSVEGKKEDLSTPIQNFKRDVGDKGVLDKEEGKPSISQPIGRGRRLSNSSYSKEIRKLQKLHENLQNELGPLRQKLKKLKERKEKAQAKIQRISDDLISLEGGEDIPKKKGSPSLKLYNNQPQAMSSLGRLTEKINSKEHNERGGGGCSKTCPKNCACEKAKKEAKEICQKQHKQ